MPFISQLHVLPALRKQMKNGTPFAAKSRWIHVGPVVQTSQVRVSQNERKGPQHRSPNGNRQSPGAYGWTAPSLNPQRFKGGIRLGWRDLPTWRLRLWSLPWRRIPSSRSVDARGGASCLLSGGTLLIKSDETMILNRWLAASQPCQPRRR